MLRCESKIGQNVNDLSAINLTNELQTSCLELCTGKLEINRKATEVKKVDSMENKCVKVDGNVSLSSELLIRSKGDDSEAAKVRLENLFKVEQKTVENIKNLIRNKQEMTGITDEEFIRFFIKFYTRFL